jgi:hypothetical protein
LKPLNITQKFCLMISLAFSITAVALGVLSGSATFHMTFLLCAIAGCTLAALVITANRLVLIPAKIQRTPLQNAHDRSRTESIRR